jgi:hypothetical protein
MSATNLNNLTTMLDSNLNTAESKTNTISNDGKSNLTPSSSYTPSNRFPNDDTATLEQHVQHQVQQHQLFLHRQNSLRLSTYIKKKNDLESKLNRL